VTDLNDLLSHIPTDQIAARLGVDPATADAAIRQALPALVGGLHANAADPAAAASLAGAVNAHDPALLDGGVNVDQLDTQDGAKIVSHVFGDNNQQVVSQLGGLPGSVGSGLIAKLLPMLAPIVMAYLAKRMFGGGAASGSASASAGGGLASILGGLLGGAAGGAGAGAGSVGGFDLGSILGGLGGLLGGGTR
jgi:hypothetical protein